MNDQGRATRLPPWFVRALERGPASGDAAILLKLLERFAELSRLSVSRTEQLCKMAKDLVDWRETEDLKGFLRSRLEHMRSGQPDLASGAPEANAWPAPFARAAASAWPEFEAFYLGKQRLLPNFQRSAPKPEVPKYRFAVLEQLEGPERKPSVLERKQRILGSCPVASKKTRCCNLLTLDAIQQCGFGCSYCAIQHFYDERAIQVHGDFAQKLEQLELDPQKWYHIGTGQASDSLLWAEDLGVLQPLLAFAARYPKVILELKSKAADVQGLLKADLPPNLLATWSLNPNSFIAHEEPLTAPLEPRLRAARQLADKGVKVGFHFHPIVRYQGWKTEYRDLCERLAGLFRAEEVATVSLGTLTFSRAALKTIRHKANQTQILRFPMEEIAGKFSYPASVKCELFSHVYGALAPWHGRVFFYLCMEDPALWPEVFGFAYQSNEDFEQDMLQSYAQKMGLT